VLLVDFKMAFDTCDRARLVQVWESMGISGGFLAALTALYDDILMLVKAGGGLSEPIRTERGTKQGSELSPLIFGLFIERLHPLLEHMCPGVGILVGAMRILEQLYADDLQLAVEDPADMQRVLDALEVFCHLFGMVVNVEKTTGLILRPAAMSLARLLPQCTWRFKGAAIDVTDQATYLGLTFTGGEGAGSAAAGSLAAAGRKVMAWLLSRARQLRITQSALLCRLFDALVDPVVSYGCQVWAPGLCERLLTPGAALDRTKNPGEAAHIDFLRTAGGLPTFSHKWSVLAEYGRQPLLVRWLALTVRFWGRVRLMPPGRLLREAMDSNITLYLRARRGDSWTACFLRCLVKCGALSAQQLRACTTVQHVWDLPIDEGAVRASLATLFARVWEGTADDPRVANSDSVVASTYTRWVRGPAMQGPAPHFHAVLGFAAKRMLFRLRVGGFPLRIATGKSESRTVAVQSGGPSGGRAFGQQPDADRGPGRGGERSSGGAGSGLRVANGVAVQRQVRGLPRAERVCLVCGTPGAVEDLRHFMLECPAYSALRQRHARLFAPMPMTPDVVLNHVDQAAVASAVHAMLVHRAGILSP
jgi:hypothetical protein